MNDQDRHPRPTPVRIGPLPPEEWTDAAREVFAFWGEPDAAEEGSGTTSQMVLANHPALAMAINRFGKHVLIDNSAPAWARELATLRIAWHLKSEYEWHYHVTYALTLGMTIDQIGAIAAGPDAGEWSDPDRAVLQLVDDLWQSSRVRDETWALFSQHYTRFQQMDLVVLVGHYVMMGWAFSAFGVQIEDTEDPIGFDLKTRSGKPAAAGIKPFEQGDAAAPL